jgi:adenosylcobinamide kinase / adenosylcobinamide-phosphate guanylyltransferase
MSRLFVIGGARSGKSRYAQARAEALGLKQLFVATAEAHDDEMAERIARHRTDRGPGWETLEAPLDPASAIGTRSAANTVLLVDCLTLWASNLLLGGHDIDAATAGLVDAVEHARGPVILVANEVGLGIVPDNALARRFRDAAGTINQRVAAVATEVQLVVAGMTLKLK